MAEKVTEMRLKVDLQCPCCYKKVKKILCKFPQIRDQVYDEKNNIVRIIVVCCSPEKLRDKLCCKGRKVIKSIEIVEPPPPPPSKPKDQPKEAAKPKDPPKPTPVPESKPPQKEKPKDPEKPKESEKPKEKSDKPKEDPKPAPAPAPAPKAPEPVPNPPPPQPAPAPVSVPAFPIGVCCSECYEGRPGGPCFEGYRRPVPPIGACCSECYEGRPGGPCFEGYGRPVPPPPRYDYYGYPYGCGYNKGYYVSRCDQYFSDENPSACSIM